MPASEPGAYPHTAAAFVRMEMTQNNSHWETQTSNNGGFGEYSSNGSPPDSMRLTPVLEFVSKTYRIVNGESDEVVSWWETDGENTFVIKRVDIFELQVLPRFFSYNMNYPYFIRQLRSHGFRRVKGLSSDGERALKRRGGGLEGEAGWWEFKHPHFQRAKTSLLSKIKRIQYKEKPISSPDAAIRWELGKIKGKVEMIGNKLDDLLTLTKELDARIRGTTLPIPMPTPRRRATMGSTAEPWAGGIIHHYQQQQQQRRQQQRRQQQQRQQQKAQSSNQEYMKSEQTDASSWRGNNDAPTYENRDGLTTCVHQVTSGAFIQGIVEHGRERSTKNYNRSKPLSRVSGGVAKRGRTCCSPSHNFHQHQPSRSVEDPFLSNGAAGSVSAGGEMEATVGGQAAGGSAFFGAAFSTISGSDAPRAHTNGSWLGGYTPEASGVGDRRCDG